MSGKKSEVLARSEELYAQLTNVYPRDPRLLRKYADILHRRGKPAQAEKAWMRLHALLLGAGDVEAVRALESEHPFLASEQAVETPAKAGFLSFLDTGPFERLMTRLKERKLEENEYLFRAGEKGHAMYIVLDGHLLALGDDRRDGSRIILNVLRKGDVVGEQAMLQNRPRSADVIAAAPARVFELGRGSLMEVFTRYPKAEAAFLRESDIRHRMTQISRNALLARLPLRKRRELAVAASLSLAAKDERICEGGAPIREIRLLTRGVVDAVHETRRGESRILHSLQAGEMIGEWALLGGARYPADIRATTDIEWLELPLNIMQDLFLAYPALRLQLKTILDTKISRSMRALQKSPEANPR